MLVQMPQKCSACRLDREDILFISRDSVVLCLRCYAVRRTPGQRIEMIYLHGLKWIGVSLIFLTALAFAGFGVLLALPEHQEPGKTLWVAGIVMGLIGATLGWLGSRAARRRVLPFRGDGAQSNSVHDSLGRLLWDEAVTEGSMQLAELAALYQNVSSSSPVALKEGFDAGLDAALQKRHGTRCCLFSVLWHGCKPANTRRPLISQIMPFKYPVLTR